MKFLPSQVQYLSRRMLDHDQAAYTLFTNVAPVEINSLAELLEHPLVDRFTGFDYAQFSLGNEVACWDDLDDSVSLFVTHHNGQFTRVGFLFEADTDALFKARDARGRPVFLPVGPNF